MSGNFLEALELTLDTLVVSDTHLGHKNILKFCPSRKVIYDKTTKKITPEDILLKNIFEDRGEGEVIFHLGDYAFNGQGINKYRDSLLETDTILLPGNHDKKTKQNFIYNGFNKVIEGVFVENYGLTFRKALDYKNLPFCNAYIVNIEGVKIMFSHFPVFHDCPHDKAASFYPSIQKLEEIYIKENCDFNIHGHTHEKNSSFPNSFNVSVEQINFKPISIRDILTHKGLI